MANKIQHKRSTTGGATPTLSAGELAFNLVDKRVFTANDTTVFDAFQNTTSSIAISNATGGVLFVGNATYNTVINATHISIANSTNSVSFTSPTTVQKGGNYYLKADGTWATVSASASPGGSNTHVQFNDSTTLGGSAGFTFDKTTNNAVVANTLTVNNLIVNESLSINTDTFSLGNSTVNSTINSIAVYITNSTVNTTLTIPTSAQWTATNYFLHANGSWVQVTAGGGTPGGGAADVQYANNGAFAGNSGFQFTYSTNNVTIANTVTVGSTSIINSTYIGMGTGFKANTTSLNPTANTLLLGNSIGRWVISGNTLDLTGALTSTGNVTTTGNVNSAIGYFTGLVNAAHFTTTGNANASSFFAGANVTANTTTVRVGNSIVNTVIANDNLWIGNSTFYLSANQTAVKMVNSVSNTTWPMPTATERGENRYLKVDGTWSTVTASAAPAGSNTNIQINDSGSTYGSNGFTFDKTTNNVYIANTLTVDGALVVNSDAFGVGNAEANACLQATGLYIANSTSNTRIEVPNTVMYSSTNYVLHANGSWITAPGGGAQPAGANTYVQFNEGGSALGGNAGFTYDRSTNTVFIANSITIGSGTSNSVINTTAIVLQTNSTANTIITDTNYVASRSITILDPINTDSATIFWTNSILTLDRIKCVVRGTTPSVTFSVYSATDRTATTTTHINANVCSNTTTGNTLTSFGSATIAANTYVYLNVTGVSGTVNEFHATLYFV